MALKIKLIKSFSSASKDQLATIAGLGLRKLGQEKLLKDTPAIRGMVFKVRHLVASEVVKGDAKVRTRMKPRRVRLREAARA